MNLSELKALLARHSLHLNRDLGQNFLVDPGQARRLTDLAGVRAGDSVLEIGTGLGALTRALAERAERIVTIEVDAGVVRTLREEALLPEGVELIHADALKLDLGERVRALPPPVRVVANLPYSAASPLLRRLLDLRELLEDWSVMLQREVARRLVAAPGGRDYGSLSVLHQLTVDLDSAADLSPDCFFPVPKVASSFLRMFPRRDVEVSVSELQEIEGVVRAAFRQRRKTLVNSLLGSPAAGGRDRAALEAVLDALGIDPRTRAERLDPDTFRRLTRALSSD